MNSVSLNKSSSCGEVRNKRMDNPRRAKKRCIDRKSVLVNRTDTNRRRRSIAEESRPEADTRKRCETMSGDRSQGNTLWNTYRCEIHQSRLLRRTSKITAAGAVTFQLLNGQPPAPMHFYRSSKPLRGSLVAVTTECSYRDRSAHGCKPVAFCSLFSTTWLKRPKTRWSCF